MGRLSRIESVINGTIDAYAHSKLVPRGLLYYADTLLRGTIRFAKRTGNSISVFSPDNTYKLAENVNSNTNSFYIANTSKWMCINAILSMGPGQEFAQISDISDTLVTVLDTLIMPYTTIQSVQLYAVPIQAGSNTQAGATSMTVQTYYPLANGDSLVYMVSSGLLQSTTEVLITQVVDLGSSTDPYYTHLYQVGLAGPLLTSFEYLDEIYMKCKPAYFGTSVKVPQLATSSDQMGPFLMDYMSGMMIEGVPYKETFSIRGRDRTGSIVLGTGTDFMTVSKNHVIMERPIKAHTPLFWQLAEGTFRFTPSRIVLNVGDQLGTGIDANGYKFCAETRCTPNIEADTTWSLSVKANQDLTLRFWFKPYGFQEFTLTSGLAQTITVGAIGSQPITHIMINVLASASDGQVTMSDWTTNNATIDSMDYCIVADAIGISTWQSSGLICKPYFLSTDVLGTNYDIGTNYDSGKVYF